MGLSAFLYKGLKGYKFTYTECQSEVWLVIAEMIDGYDNETDIPFVYRLKHKVFHNRYKNIIEYIKAQCRRLDYIHKIQNIEHLKKMGRISQTEKHIYILKLLRIKLIKMKHIGIYCCRRCLQSKKG